MGNRGFSLIEVIVSFMLILLLFVFVITVFPNTRKAMQNAENHQYASALGRNLLSEARRTDFDNISDSTGTRTDTGLDDGLKFTRTFEYRVSVVNVTPDSKRVWADVYWGDSTGRKKVTLETIIARK